MGVLGDVEHREIGEHIGVDQRREGDADQQELGHRRRAGHRHQPRVVAERAGEGDRRLRQRQHQREDQGEVAEFAVISRAELVEWMMAMACRCRGPQHAFIRQYSGLRKAERPNRDPSERRHQPGVGQRVNTDMPAELDSFDDTNAIGRALALFCRGQVAARSWSPVK